MIRGSSMRDFEYGVDGRVDAEFGDTRDNTVVASK